MRPICEAVWEAMRVRSERPCGRPIGPLMHTGRCCDPRGHLTDFTAKRIASAGRGTTGPRIGQHCPVCVRGRSASHTASHFGLSDRSHDFVVRGRARPPTASHSLRGRSDSQRVGGRGRPSTASHAPGHRTPGEAMR